MPVNSIIELKAITGSSVNNFYNVLGYHVPGDGGGGDFYWDASNTSGNDNGIIIQPTSANGAGRWVRIWHNYITPEMYGAQGDGETDNTSILTAIFNNPYNIVFTQGKTYNISNTVVVTNISNKTITAVNAIISRTDNTKKMFEFDNPINVSIVGGKWTCSTMPNVIGPNGNEHVFEFITALNISVRDVWIYGSPQMGIVFNHCIGATTLNNKVEQTWRDGIHHLYTVNIVCKNNFLDNIKDDSISIIDYGIEADKTNLINAGYSQSGYAEVSGNIINSAYQGITALGSQYVNIHDNKINGTVLAGVAVFSSDALLVEGTSTSNNCRICNNDLQNTNVTQIIIGISYTNNGQNATGRAGIFVCPLDSSSQIGGAKRLNNIIIQNNKITSGGESGMYLQAIDNLLVESNTAINCCSNKSPATGGTVNGIYSDTLVTLINNSTIDNRATIIHNICFDINTIAYGRLIKGTNQGFLYTEYHTDFTISLPDLVITMSNTVTGDNITTAFIINHTLLRVPNQVVPANNSSTNLGFYYISAKTAESFTITFVTAPPTGSYAFDFVLN